MKKIFKTYKKIFIGLTIFLVVLLVVPIAMYYATYTYVGKQELYNNLLTYFGAYVAFSGTIFLGIVSLVQTNVANEQNDRLLQLSEAEFIPIISILSVSLARYKNCSAVSKKDHMDKPCNRIMTCDIDTTPETCTGLILELRNDSKYPISEIQVEFVNKYDQHFYKNGKISTYLACNELQFYSICTVGNLGTTKLRIIVRNAFNYQITLELDLVLSRDEEVTNFRYKLIKDK